MECVSPNVFAYQHSVVGVSPNGLVRQQHVYLMEIVSPDGVARHTMHVCVVVVVVFVCACVCYVCVCFLALLFVYCFSQWARLPNTMQCFETYFSKWALCQRMNIVEGGFSQLFCPSKTHKQHEFGEWFLPEGLPIKHVLFECGSSQWFTHQTNYAFKHGLSQLVRLPTHVYLFEDGFAQ